MLAVAMVAAAWVMDVDAAVMMSLITALGIGVGAAGAVAVAIIRSLPPVTTAWLLGYHAALGDAEVRNTVRHLRRQ